MKSHYYCNQNVKTLYIDSLSVYSEQIAHDSIHACQSYQDECVDNKF
jgi:hypothetical protein